jgi:hypothetical protein
MTGHGTKFGRQQEHAIAALLTARNLEEAAKAAGISTSTLKRWMKLPEFKEAYRQARGELMAQNYARIQQNTGALTGTLFKLGLDPATPASVRADVCQDLLDRADKSFEQEKKANVDERLTQIEKVVGIDTAGPRKFGHAA